MKKSRLLAAVCACFITYVSLPANAISVTNPWDHPLPEGGNVSGTLNNTLDVRDIYGDGSGYYARSRSEADWSTTRNAEDVSAMSQIAFLPDDYGYDANVYAQSWASLIYNVGAEYLGVDPAPSRQIPINLAWSLSAYTAQSDGDGNSVFLRDNRVAAAINIGGNTSTPFSARVDSRGSSSYYSQLVEDSGIENLTFSSGGVLQVNLGVSTRLSGQSRGSFSATAYAYADPVITIDPAWEFADLYALNYTTAEIQDSRTSSLSSVPVPAAVWLFGSGLLGLVGIARRKKTA